MEVILAMTLFAIVATALLGVLVSGVSAQSLARQKTIGEQAATAAIESLRELPYASIGNPGRNPNGTITLSRSISAVLGQSTPGLSGTVTTKVDWNNSPLDKVATSYRNAAFYKKITVTVTRSDGKQLAQMVTYVSDQSGGTGINDAEIDLSVIDLGTTNPISGQDVNLTTGPSAPLTDATDSAGSIVFPALTANPTSGATAYYNLGLTPLSGYTLLKDDDIAQTPSSSTAHVQLAPSQVWPTTLRLYKGSTVTVALQNQATGTTYTGNATVTLSTTLRGAAASKTLAYSGGPVSTNSFSGEPIIPSPSALITGGYTAAVSNGFFATAVTKTTVPNTYPTDLTSTFTLVGYPTGTLTATVTWAGQPVSGATVVLTGGPTGVNLSATTNSSGIATFTDLPAGSGYNLAATKSGQTGTATATVTAGATTNVGVAMPVGTIAATVTLGGAPVNGATVTVTGGPMSVNLSAVTNTSGVATFSNVPAGTGYSVAVTQGTNTVTQTGVSVTGGSTTNVSLGLPTGTVRVTVTWAGVAVANCANCVTISGGNLSSPVTGSTDSSGVATFANVPVGTGYTVAATKSGQSATQTGVSVSNGATTNVSLALPTGTIAVTVTSGGLGVLCTNCVTISGGNLSAPVTGSTNASGQVNFINVPAGTGYTVTVTTGGSTSSQSGVSVTGGATTNVSLTLATGSLQVTVTSGGSPVQCTNCVTVSGGALGSTVTGSTNSSGVATFAIPPGSGYTVAATNGGTSASQSGVTVTAGSTTNVSLALPVGSIRATVTWAGVAVANCVNCVTVSGGGLGSPLTGSTDASGVATFSNLPATTGYTVTATKSGQSANQTGISVSSGATTNVSIALPTGTVAVTVTWGGAAVANCTNCVTLSGGNLSAPVTGSTNASGQVNFINVPTGTGYTVTATKNSQSANQSGLSVTNGATTNVSIALPTGTVAVTVTAGGGGVQCTNCVTISGGNLTASVTGTTNASGQVNFLNVPTGTGYTVAFSNAGASASASSVTVSTGATTNVPLTIGVGTVVANIDQPAGTNAPNASVTLSGGNLGSSVNATADATGQVTFTNVPVGTGYSVQASRYGQSATTSGQTVTNATTTTVNINLANYTQGSIAVTVKRSGGSNCNSTAFNWTISGGPYSYNATGSATTNTSGVLGTFSGIPAGSGYSVNVKKVSNASQQGTTNSVTVTSGSTTSINVTLNTNTCP